MRGPQPPNRTTLIIVFVIASLMIQPSTALGKQHIITLIIDVFWNFNIQRFFCYCKNKKLKAIYCNKNSSSIRTTIPSLAIKYVIHILKDLANFLANIVCIYCLSTQSHPSFFKTSTCILVCHTVVTVFHAVPSPTAPIDKVLIGFLAHQPHLLQPPRCPCPPFICFCFHNCSSLFFITQNLQFTLLPHKINILYCSAIYEDISMISSPYCHT